MAEHTKQCIASMEKQEKDAHKRAEESNARLVAAGVDTSFRGYGWSIKCTCKEKRNPRLPATVGSLEVGDDGVLRHDGLDCFPWINEAGFIGGTVRYTLLAEEVPREELFATTQETH